MQWTVQQLKIGFLLALLITFLSACAQEPLINEYDFYSPVPESIPEGYSALYIYRTQEPWTQETRTRIYINETPIAVLGDSTYTKVLMSPGFYLVANSPWSFFSYFYIAPNQMYFLDLQLETVLFPDKPPQGVQYVKIDNTRYITGEYLMKSGPAAKPELAACRYVKPERKMMYSGA